MIRSAVLLIRTSLPSVLLLAASLTVLSGILSEEPDDRTADRAGSLPSLAPLPPRPAGSGAAAILQTALFDPAHRAESIAGAIDDLRSGAAAPPADTLSVAGVLLSGGTRRAMMVVGGGAPTWSSVGAEVGGWRLASVDQDGAVVERDGRSLTLRVADRYKLRGRPHGEAAATAADTTEAPLDYPGPPSPP